MSKHQSITDKMRRFTFAAYNTSEDKEQILCMNSDIILQQILKESGVVDYNFCTKDSISYLILDMKESFDLEKTRNLFMGLLEMHSELEVLCEIIKGKYLLLDRIYKLEQQKEYKAEEGQLIPIHKKDYARYVLTLEVINDPVLAKEYAAVHGIGKAWPEITQNMKTVGIHEMEIYMFGYRAFLIMDTKPDFEWDVDGKKWGELHREKEWQAYVAKFQKTDPESKAAEKWKTMEMLTMGKS